jgi:hypothetical protein
MRPCDDSSSGATPRRERQAIEPFDPLLCSAAESFRLHDCASWPAERQDGDKQRSQPGWVMTSWPSP